MTPSASLGPEERTLPPVFRGSFRDYLADEMPDEVTASAQAIAAAHGGENSRQFSAYLSCRTRAWFLRNKETGKLAVVSNACRVRGCPFCARSKGLQIAHNLAPWLKKLRGPKHMILTLRHTDQPLPEQIDHLYKAFAKLRRYRRWTRTVRGGLWFAQVTASKKTNQWHPHLHCLCDADYYPQSLLSRDWARASKTSHNVFVRRIHDTSKACRDASRYVARPGWLHALSPKQRTLLLFAFSGRRLCGAWGTARKAGLLTVPKMDRSGWERLGSFGDIVHQAATDPQAAAILLAWQNGDALETDTYLAEVSDALDAAFRANAREPPKPLLYDASFPRGAKGMPSKARDITVENQITPRPPYGAAVA